MAQFTESSDLASESNGDVKIVNGALVPRDQDFGGYTALGAPMLPPVWQEPSASGMSVTKMLHSFRRRWMLALFVGLMLGIPAALATWLIFPKQFEVQAVLQFRNVEGFLSDEGPADAQAVKQYRETQLHLIRSPMLLTAAIRNPKIANLGMIRKEDEPVYFLQKSLNVSSPRDTNLIIIRMTGEDAREMVEIVREITTKYLAQATDTARAQRNERIVIIDKRLRANEKDLIAKRANKLELARRMGVGDGEEITRKKNLIAEDIRFWQARLGVLETEKSQADQEVARLTARQKSIESGDYPEAILMEGINEHPRMIKLQERISEVSEMLQYEKTAARNPQSDPAVLRRLRQLQGLQEDEAQLTARLRETELAKMKWGKDRPEESLPVAETRARNLDEQIAKIQGEIDEKKKELLSLSSDSAEIAQQTQDIKQLEDTYARLTRRSEEAWLSVSLPPPVDLLEPAEEPEGSTLVYRVILTTFLGLVSFCVGLGGVVLLEYTKQRVSTLNEIGYGGLGLRVLGTVPNLARLSRQKNGDANGSVAGILAESIDSVRCMLLSNKRPDAPKVILVTSADEHEGKTTVASHLAASLARAGRRTLLIDGDLRKPAIHMLFDMPLTAGLCEVLRGDAEIDAVVHPAQVEGMWVMLAGQCDQRAIASLAKENAEAAFRTLRGDFDFVVVDSGPALAFADTMLMGSHADAAVMAILRDVSQIPKVYEARERLEAIGLPVLGGVVGGVALSGNRNYALLN